MFPPLIASANKQMHLHPRLLPECIFLLHTFDCTLFQKVKIIIWEKCFWVKMDFELLSVHWLIFESRDWILKYLLCIINFIILLHAKMEISVMGKDKMKIDLMVKRHRVTHAYPNKQKLKLTLVAKFWKTNPTVF